MGCWDVGAPKDWAPEPCDVGSRALGDARTPRASSGGFWTSRASSGEARTRISLSDGFWTPPHSRARFGHQARSRAGFGHLARLRARFVHFQPRKWRNVARERWRRPDVARKRKKTKWPRRYIKERRGWAVRWLQSLGSANNSSGATSRLSARRCNSFSVIFAVPLSI